MYKLALPWPLATIQFPISDWLSHYTQDKMVNDIIAGITVFIFLIPQGMAYSLLAGMPAIYGLYSSIVPLYIYTIFGTSYQLSMGPMATTSLLLSVAANSFNYAEQSHEYITIIMKISFVVGVIILFMGLFKFGTIANLISGSVLVGFLTASSLVICLNQLKNILGISVPRFDYTCETIYYILSHLNITNPLALVLGIVNFMILYYIKRWKQNNKPTTEMNKLLSFRLKNLFAKASNFISLIFGSIIAYIIIINHGTIPVVGTIPSGLKYPMAPSISFSEFLNFIPTSLAIAFVAFAGNWAVATKYAMINDYKVDATQELLAEGFSVIIGVFFNAFAGSAGLARTSVAAESGATTPMFGWIVATLMLISVECLTLLFYYIPMTILASIIIVSILSMIDFESMIKAYKVHKQDCFVMVFTFLTTFFIGVATGLYFGIFLSIGSIVYTTSFPNIVHLGKLPESEGGYFRDINRFKNAEQIPGITIIRMDATLFFGNCEHFKNVIMKSITGEFHSNKEQAIKQVVIDASCWIDIDLAGINILFDLKNELVEKRGILLAIVSAKGIIRDKLEASSFFNDEKANYHNYSVNSAINYGAVDDVDYNTVDEGCGVTDCSNNNNNNNSMTRSTSYMFTSNPLHHNDDTNNSYVAYDDSSFILCQQFPRTISNELNIENANALQNNKFTSENSLENIMQRLESFKSTMTFLTEGSSDTSIVNNIILNNNHARSNNDVDEPIFFNDMP